MEVEKVVEKSRKELKKMTADEMMSKASDLERKILRLCLDAELTPCVLVGVLEGVKMIIGDHVARMSMKWYLEKMGEKNE